MSWEWTHIFRLAGGEGDLSLSRRELRMGDARLGTHRDDRARGRANKDNAVIGERLREPCIFAQEAVSRVNSLCVGGYM